ncbi:hypothetical protein LMG667_17415 [Xanthomonas euvesicatoria]|uniref:hypothetical protein n=1 Tax=Xanthomonas euvesicatoria TaxID=456327 RepID=UPI00080DFB72|nr:hypothetical protein [Xanthomonas euvesicatoria]OCG83440.1 hypothetical protein LMG667_17415 [Xanthomonas euvesicatoria]
MTTATHVDAPRSNRLALGLFLASAVPYGLFLSWMAGGFKGLLSGAMGMVGLLMLAAACGALMESAAKLVSASLGAVQGLWIKCGCVAILCYYGFLAWAHLAARSVY